MLYKVNEAVYTSRKHAGGLESFAKNLWGNEKSK